MFSNRNVEYVIRMRCVGLVIYLVALGTGYSKAASEKSDTLGTAHLPAVVKQRIYEQVAKDLTPLSDEERAAIDTYGFRFSKLGIDGHLGVQVWGTGDVCGSHNCPFWLFDQKTGVSLLSGSAGYVSMTHRAHHGRYDIEVVQMGGPINSDRDLYRFDGQAYQLVRSTFVRGSDQN